MPAEETKYGTLYTERESFHPGEPVFLLRATDPLTPLALQDYAHRCQEAGCDASFIESVKARANEIAEWQANNPTLVKDRPD